jgi:hypothetical protein
MGSKVNDGMLGAFNISDSILVELMKAKEVLRLKGIAQQGVPEEMLEKGMPAYSRYEHSVGVMLMLRMLGADLEEQAAGLLHDVSHTAFSHIVDWTIGNRSKEDYQDSIHAKYFKDTEISRILKKHGLDPDRISKPVNYGLLEREIPDLCADRVESNLRYWHYMGRKDIVKECLDGIIINDGEIVFNSTSAARTFSLGYLGWQSEGEGWGMAKSPLELSAKALIFADLLKLSLDKKVIRVSDFEMDDNYVIGKVKGSKDSEIRYMLKKMYVPPVFRLAKSSRSVHLKEKFRYVDPKCLIRGKISRLSALDSDYKTLLTERRKTNEKGYDIELD